MTNGTYLAFAGPSEHADSDLGGLAEQAVDLVVQPDQGQ
jgi:hypothetical protein